MGTSKRKTVFNADSEVLAQARELVEAGQYKTLSEFIREAMAEKIKALHQLRLREAVAQYCAAGHAGEDPELIEAQAVDDDGQPTRRKTERRRAEG